MVKKTGIIQEETIQSKELGADMTILIYLPVNYSPLYISCHHCPGWS